MTEAPDTKTCVSCGATFGCGANATACWCFEKPLSQAALDAVRARFPEEACLCPDCLRAFRSAAD